jgi:hypothetical protein
VIPSQGFSARSHQLPEIRHSRSGEVSSPLSATAADLFQDQAELDTLRKEVAEQKEIRAHSLWTARKLKGKKMLFASVRYAAGLAVTALAAGSIINPLFAPLALLALAPAFMADKAAIKHLPKVRGDIARHETIFHDSEKHLKNAEKREAEQEEAISTKDEVLQQTSPTIDVQGFTGTLSRHLGPLADVHSFAEQLPLAGRLPRASELRGEFNEIRQDRTVPWEHIVDGCYARAHSACEKLLRDGIGCGKLFVNVRHSENDRLTAQNRFQKAEWWYHVASLVFAENEKTGKPEPYIIDMSVNDRRPMKPHEWISHFWQKDFPIDCYVTPADIYDGDECSPEAKNATFSFKRFAGHQEDAMSTNESYGEVLAKLKKKHYGRNK